jgi:hypothetical protein
LRAQLRIPRDLLLLGVFLDQIALRNVLKTFIVERSRIGSKKLVAACRWRDVSPRPSDFRSDCM